MIMQKKTQDVVYVVILFDGHKEQSNTYVPYNDTEILILLRRKNFQ